MLLRCLQKDPRRRWQHIGDARIEIEEAPSEPEVVVPRPHRPYWAAAVAVGGIAVGFLLRPVPETERPVSRFTLKLPPEQSLVWFGDPPVALSPDGSRIVYAAEIAGESKLYVRPIDQLGAVGIPGTEDAFAAFFSPDGEWLGFYGKMGKLMKVRLDSGLPIPLCDAPDAGGASWGRGDTILFAPSPRSGLSRTSASGGAPSVVTTPDSGKGETAHLWPDILPDGKTALFTIRAAAGASRIGLVSLETGESRVLLEEASFARYVPTGHLLYVREATVLAAPFDLERLELTGEPVPVLEGVSVVPVLASAQFAVSPDGTLAYVPPLESKTRLVWVDRAGSVQPVTETRRDFFDPRLSPDGRRISLTIGKGEVGRYDVWTYELERDSFVRLTFGEDSRQAIWTPDGKRLAFRRGEPTDLFWMPADGSGPEERILASPASWTHADSWSPDGRDLLYTESESASAADIWALTPGAEPRPILETPFFESNGVVSPDGRHMAFASNESGRFEVYVRPFPGPGGKWPISNEGGELPVWARSGREIFYWNDGKMMAVGVETKPEFRATKPAVLFKGKFFSEFDVTPDGKRFVMIESEESLPTRIEVVLNWTEELKERVPVRPR